jgi:hypothetical protein
MIAMRCREVHGGGACRECEDLGAYVRLRVDRCPFGPAKATCARCTVHCYRPDMRERIRAVMRFAGPRMAWRHPILSLLHLFDGRRLVPSLRGRAP